MVLELAKINIQPGTEQEFEAAFNEAIKNIAAAQGYQSHQLKRCIEDNNQYALFIHWNTLEDHTVAFRESAAFKAWRELIQPYLAGPPVVEHYEDVSGDTT